MNVKKNKNPPLGYQFTFHFSPREPTDSYGALRGKVSLTPRQPTLQANRGRDGRSIQTKHPCVPEVIEYNKDVPGKETKGKMCFKADKKENVLKYNYV